MKTKFAAALTLLACTSFAQADDDFIRVMTFKLKPACEITDVIQLNTQFNEWGRAHKVTGEILVQVFGENPGVHVWTHRLADAGAWGKQMDAWKSGIMEGQPTETTLWGRWMECIEELSTSGYYGFSE